MQKKKKTQGAKVPTWGQLRKLTPEAQQMEEKEDLKATPSTMVLAMLAFVSYQSSAKSYSAKSRDSE